MNVIRDSIQCLSAVCLLIGLLECALDEAEPDENIKLLMGLAVSVTVVRALVDAIRMLL